MFLMGVYKITFTSIPLKRVVFCMQVNPCSRSRSATVAILLESAPA
jgi:hypothetical protein